MARYRPSADGRDPEIWGWCAVCARWYFCQGWFDRAAPHPHCPVCLSEPTEIENRAGRAGFRTDPQVGSGQA